jgi:hypothetical protein
MNRHASVAANDLIGVYRQNSSSARPETLRIYEAGMSSEAPEVATYAPP